MEMNGILSSPPPIPIDVADVVAFLASEDSGYITGASVEVTGMRPAWGGRGQRSGTQII
jgi:17beta-estradiol 17-dehydrogenase/3alpha(17beta)-hydroxysteroid dehydrogenase (NAD+)